MKNKERLLIFYETEIYIRNVLCVLINRNASADSR